MIVLCKFQLLVNICTRLLLCRLLRAPSAFAKGGQLIEKKLGIANQ